MILNLIDRDINDVRHAILYIKCFNQTRGRRSLSQVIFNQHIFGFFQHHGCLTVELARFKLEFFGCFNLGPQLVQEGILS